MKDFDRWNGIKKQTEIVELKREVYINSREVWWCALGVNLGVETDGKNNKFERPVLIFRVFNRHMVWVLPITSTKKEDRFHFKIRYGSEDRFIILSQLRTVSTKRLLRKIDVVNIEDFNKVQNLISKFCTQKSENPPNGG